MANKRDLKKQIKYLCGEVALHCILTRECVEGTDAEALNQLVLRAADLQEKSVKNVTFSFDKTPSQFENRAQYNKAARDYFHQAYKKFQSEFNKHIQEIVDSLNKAIPESQREQNKKTAKGE